MNRTVTPEEPRSLLERHDVLVVDVRRRADYDADTQTIPGAIRRDPEEAELWSENLPHDKQIVVYGTRGGTLSHAMVDRLQAKGFRARDVEGGIEAWRKAGGETVDK